MGLAACAARRPTRVLLRITLIGAACLGALLHTREARADDTPDTVMLANGGRVRGTVMEEDPQRGVSIKLLDGTTKRLAPKDIKQVVYGQSEKAPEPSVAIVPAPPPPQPASTPAFARPNDAGLVRVHVDTDNPDVTIDWVTSEAFASGYRVAVSGTEWTTVCTGSCDKDLDPNHKYRVGGDNVVNTGFLLPHDQGVLTLHIDAGSGRVRTGGVLLLVLGVSAVLSGAIILPLGSVANDSGLTAGGAVSLAVGAAITIPGIVLMAVSRTKVTTDAGKRIGSNTVGDPTAPYVGLDGLHF